MHKDVYQGNLKPLFLFQNKNKISEFISTIFRYPSAYNAIFQRISTMIFGNTDNIRYYSDKKHKTI